MSKQFSDQEIAALLQESKPLPGDWRQQTTLRQKRGHKEKDLNIEIPPDPQGSLFEEV